VVHRDIKPDNLLIDKQDNLHIADFGVSQIIDQSEEIAGSAGTKAFLPPEAYEAKNYNGKAADIWAAGVCFYFLATG
jgi:serine/threonine protein kinase